LPREVFTEEFFRINGLTATDEYGRAVPLLDIDDASNGWMLRAGEHRLEPNSVHRQGWNEDWINWAEENKGSITVEMIEAKKNEMIREFDLPSRGFSTESSYRERQAAYRGAQKLALQNDPKARRIMDSEDRRKSGASSNGSKAVDSDLAGGQESGKSSDRKQPRKSGRVCGKSGPIVRGGVLGLGVGLVSSALMGSETPLEDSFESLDIFSPASMGGSEIDPDLWRYEAWDRYQKDLDRRWIQRAGERVQARFAIE
jgi:hypothetical protein